MSEQAREQFRRDDEHFVSFGDEHRQVVEQVRDVEDMIVDQVSEGFLTTEDAKHFSLDLRRGTLTPIEVMGMLVLNKPVDLRTG